DRCNLFMARPDARKTPQPLRGEAEILQRAEDGLLQRPHVLLDVLVVGAQVQDGIAHQLARPVVGHTASALNVINFEPLAGKKLARDQQMVGPGGAAAREYRLVLQQDEPVRQLFPWPRPDQSLLQRPGIGIRRRTLAEIEEPTLPHGNHSNIQKTGTRDRGNGGTRHSTSSRPFRVPAFPSSRVSRSLLGFYHSTVVGNITLPTYVFADE